MQSSTGYAEDDIEKDFFPLSFRIGPAPYSISDVRRELHIFDHDRPRTVIQESIVDCDDLGSVWVYRNVLLETFSPSINIC